MDIVTLLAAAQVGAQTFAPEIAKIIGTEVVKETTKDAYKKLKATAIDILGRPASRALAKLEADPASRASHDEFASAFANVPKEDEPELDSRVADLLAAIADDPAASKLAAAASIKLNIDAGGHVIIERLSGGRTLDVTSKSVGNFELRDVNMDMPSMNRLKWARTTRHFSGAS